jgi:hypothetical protein
MVWKREDDKVGTIARDDRHGLAWRPENVVSWTWLKCEMTVVNVDGRDEPGHDAKTGFHNG